MSGIQSTVQLKEAIRVLELERAAQKQQLEQSIRQTCETFRPSHLLEDLLQEASSSALLSDRLLSSTLGLATSFLVKKIITGKSGNKIRTLLGLVVEAGIKNLLSKHRSFLRYFSQRFLQRLFHLR